MNMIKSLSTILFLSSNLSLKISPLLKFHKKSHIYFSWSTTLSPRGWR